MIQLMNLLTMSWDVSKSSSRILFLITSLTKSKDILNTGCRTWKNIIYRSKTHSSEVTHILHFPRWWVFHYCQLEEHTRQEKWAWGRNSQGKERGRPGPGTTPSGISGREPASSGGSTNHYWDLYRVMITIIHHHSSLSSPYRARPGLCDTRAGWGRGWTWQWGGSRSLSGHYPQHSSWSQGSLRKTSQRQEPKSKWHWRPLIRKCYRHVLVSEGSFRQTGIWPALAAAVTVASRTDQVTTAQWSSAGVSGIRIAAVVHFI